MTEIIIPKEKEENNKINQINLSEEKPVANNYKSLIKSILESKELSNLTELKLQKYKNSTRKLIPNKKDKSYIPKLEEGYESSDSGDSVQSTSTILTSSTSSTLSGMSYLSYLPNSINSMVNSSEKSLPEKRIFLSKIFEEINALKTVIPKEKLHDYNYNTNNNIIINNNNEKDKKTNIDLTYPLEYFEIFPNLNKYKIGNELNNASIVKPILFIKNLISKNYHESLYFTKDKFELQNYKNSIYYNYKILKQSEPISPSYDNENITCIINEYFFDNNIDKKNNIINNFNEKIKKFKKGTIKEKNFIFFGYKNGLIRQTVLIILKAAPSGETKNDYKFFLYREYKVNDIIKEQKLDKHVLCMSLSEDQNYLLAGYASGHFIIWKTSNGKTFYISDEKFDMPVVACEFIYISENNKEFLFLISDLLGRVYLMHLKKHFFTDEVQKIIVTKCSYPCLLLKKLKFNKHDGGKDFNINNLINKIKDQDYLCALGNSEYIEVISINRKLKDIYSMYLIRNPDFKILNPMTEEIKNKSKENYSKINLSQIEFPDFCFGLGYIGDLIKFRDEKDYKKEFPEILFAVSWKNLIRLFLLNETLDQIVEIGWYMNNCSIIKIDFIGVSLLYFLDKKNNIKIINIKLFNSSFNTNYKIEKERKIQKKNKYLIPLTDIITLENPVKTISKAFTETINFYNPFIVKNDNNIFLIEEKINSRIKDFGNFRHVHLKSYREFFDETMNDKNWPLFFCKFIDMIKIGSNTLGQIPENKEKKENLLIEKIPNKKVKYDYLKQFLEINKTVFDEDEDEFNLEEDTVKTCLNLHS